MTNKQKLIVIKRASTYIDWTKDIFKKDKELFDVVNYDWFNSSFETLQEYCEDYIS